MLAKSLHDRCFLRQGAPTEDSMLNREHNGHAADSSHPADEATAAGEAHEPNPAVNEAVTVAATVGVVAAGVALFEVALLPGMVIGVAAMLAPKYVPKMGAALTPMFKSTVRGAYKFGQQDPRDGGRGQGAGPRHRRRGARRGRYRQSRAEACRRSPRRRDSLRMLGRR